MSTDSTIGRNALRIQLESRLVNRWPQRFHGIVKYEWEDDAGMCGWEDAFCGKDSGCDVRRRDEPVDPEREDIGREDDLFFFCLGCDADDWGEELRYLAHTIR